MAVKPRLLIISHGFPPYYGGAELAAGHLARSAQASGEWDVQVLTGDIGGRLPAREIREGVDITRVRTRKIEWARHTILELLSFLFSAQRFQPENRPDFILAFCALPAGWVARRLARRLGVPYGVILQGSDVPGYQNDRFGWVYGVIRPVLRRIGRDAARVISVSSSLRDLAMETLTSVRIDVVPNGVDPERFQPLEKPQRQGSKAWECEVIVVAQLIERKGIQYLIQAVSGMSEAFRDRIHVTLCGVGPYEPELHRQVDATGLSGQFEFAGLLSQEALVQRLREADVFVLPTLQEGLPLAMLEAMACGLPVVATRVGGIPDVIRDGEDGRLVTAGDAGALRMVLEEMMSGEKMRHEAGRAARRRALSWSWTEIWKQYEALIRVPTAGGR